ncbi:hypothetical protein QP580_05725 [Prevotella bivia]|uniref:hypothetical protein n=1 Tax=Prevotella bivia TaxID=28125 RepID=UPI00254AB9C4|nr:hypothetical protein [Prevotella bivia]MDK7762951.1 hypothetical protein [Prevotella bivia]MDZ3817634.1 hypothetical protein [Prevotella bivia]
MFHVYLHKIGCSQREYERVYNINYRYLRSVDSRKARYNEREWKHRNKGWKRHHDNGRHLGQYKYHGRW